MLLSLKVSQIRKGYVGVTGFMKQTEVEAALKVVPIDSVGFQPRLMIGALVSHKTLAGLPNKWPNRYPRITEGELTNIFVADTRALNLVHYNTHSDHFCAELLRIENMSTNLMGFQLNVAWPRAQEIEAYRLGASGSRIIVLQIGGKAIAMCDHLPIKIADKIATDYPHCLIDYILIDPSGGLGQPFDLEFARQCLSEIRERDSKIGLGVAGGLGPETLHLIEPLIAEFPDLSIDAEGKLRDSEDHLDIARMQQYIQQALELLK